MPMSNGLTGMAASPSPVLHFPPPPLGSPPLQQFMSMMSIVTWEHLDSVWAIWWQNRHPDSSYVCPWVKRLHSEFVQVSSELHLPDHGVLLCKCPQQHVAHLISHIFAQGFPHPTPVPVPASSPTIPCRPQAALAHPLNVISDGAAGHFYNFENEDFLYEAPEYRHLLIKDTHGPLRLYNM